MKKSQTSTRAQVRLLREQAYEILKDGIVTWRFKPGQELKEANLVEELGISKTPIREALMRLQNEGFVEIQPFKGAWVTSISEDDAAKIFEFRQFVEVPAVRIAAESISSDEINYIHDLINIMERVLQENNKPLYDEAHQDFHFFFINKLNNKWITKAFHNLEDYLKRIRFNVVQCGNRKNFIGDYKEMVYYIEQGQPVKASETLSRHLNSVLNSFIEMSQSSTGNS